MKIRLMLSEARGVNRAKKAKPKAKPGKAGSRQKATPVTKPTASIKKKVADKPTKKPAKRTKKTAAPAKKGASVWWMKMTVGRQQAYLKKHPKSKYADKIKAEITKAKKMGLRANEVLSEVEGKKKKRPKAKDPYRNQDTSDASDTQDVSDESDPDYDKHVSKSAKARMKEEDIADEVEDHDEPEPDAEEFDDLKDSDVKAHGDEISSFKGFIGERVRRKTQATRNTVKHGLSFFRKIGTGEAPTDKEYEAAKDLMKTVAIAAAAAVSSVTLSPVATIYIATKFAEHMSNMDTSDDDEETQEREEREARNRQREKRAAENARQRDTQDSARERRETEDIVDAYGQFIANTSPEEMKKWAQKDRQARERDVRNAPQRN